MSSLCKLCDLEDWRDPEFVRLAGDVFSRGTGPVPEHRKLWEFVKVVQALRAFEILREDAIGLSVAGGSERILYYLCHFVQRLVATDIYGIGSFSKREADERFLQNPESFAPYAYPQERLLPLFMNALDLDFPDNAFDFAFSLSSIEHFGGVRNAKRSLEEMGRVVRPGGIVVVTTECALNGYFLREVFSPRQIHELTEVSGMRLVEEIDWGVSDLSLRHVLEIHRDDLSALPHIHLKAFGSTFTSISLVFQKHMSASGCSGERHFQSINQLEQSVLELRNKPRSFLSDADRRPLWTRAQGKLSTYRERVQEFFERWWG